MTAFRLFLAALICTVAAYTARTIACCGSDFVSPFFGAIADGGWAGQFNADFLGFLSLAALWIAWRHRFRPLGLLLGAIVFVGGSPFVAAYVLIASLRAKGDMRIVLLGSTGRKD